MSEIKNYKELTAEQVERINIMKSLEKEILTNLKALHVNPTCDKRWVRIARAHFEQGFMAAVRAIAQPETVEF